MIVTNCIVCDGNPEREKRNILLSKDLLKVGMAFGTHVTYGYCTIIISCTEFKNVDNSDDTEVYDGTGSPLPTLPPIESNQKEIKINMEYLSQIINENIYSNIQPEIKSGIPGIFIIFEKISEYFRIEYNLKKISGDFNHIKYIEEKEEDIKKLKQFIEKETLIPNTCVSSSSFPAALKKFLISFSLNFNSIILFNIASSFAHFEKSRFCPFLKLLYKF